MKTAGADALLRYRVLRPLGPTRFGHAQLALLKDEGRSKGFFALELLREDWAKDPELRSSFLDEAAHTLHFEHPNVVRTQEVLAASEVCGRVTRWFAGQSLAAVLERVGRAQFPLNLHVRVLCEVLAALQYLHELQMHERQAHELQLHELQGPARQQPGQKDAAAGRLVYRDTSPAHVLITYTGQVKIVGAGFERTIDEIERRSGALFSDVDYASPELCLGYPAAPSADVYSVGVLLWEALARARRVFADTPEAKAQLRINGEEPDVDQFRRGVPDRLAQICRRAVAVSPRDRYASAQELQIDLESFLADTETDAQQNAGLGALAELMGQHFAAERAEMLSYIEQQLAEPEPTSNADDSSPFALSRISSAPSAGFLSAGSLSARSPSAAAQAAPRPEPRPPELKSDALAGLEDAELEQGALEEGPTELMPTLEPARWDDHTHTVTSFEELGPVEPGSAAARPGVVAELAPDELLRDELLRDELLRDELVPDELIPDDEVAYASPPAASPPVASSLLQAVPPSQPGVAPRFLQVPVREPDTSGHRAYSSSLPQAERRSLLASVPGWVRTAAPMAVAAALVLSIGYGIRVARSSSDSSAGSSAASASAEPAVAESAEREQTSRAVSNAALPLQVAPAAAQAVEVVPPSAPAQADAPAAAALPATAEAAANVDIVEQIGDAPGVQPSSVVSAAAPGVPEPVPAVAEPAAAAPAEAEVPAAAAATREASAAEEPAAEPEPPPLIVEELLNGEEPRPPPRARRNRAKAADSRAARSSGPQPRAIDETDPYLE